MIKIEEFDKPFDTPINEVVEVERTVPKITVEEGKVTNVEYEKKMFKETYKTTYHRLVPTTISCEDKKHEWYMSDTGKYIASCSLCTKNRFLLPTRHVLKEGHICSRDTGDILE